MVGETEQSLTKAGVLYESGVACYEELARGEILGDHDGLLKLLVHQKDRRLLGFMAWARAPQSSSISDRW